MSDKEKLSKSLLRFAIDIFKESTKDDTTTNVVLSPLSIGIALAMVYAGTKTVTKDEMEKVLHLTDFVEESSVHVAFQGLMDSLMKEQTPGLNLHIANRLYVKSGWPFIEDFQKILQNNYYSDVVSASFDEQTREDINMWVEEQTKNKIKDLIAKGSLDEMTRMFIVNAVYFKGNWKIPFNVSRTSPGKFYLSSGEEIEVNMMHNKDDYYHGFDVEMKCEILGLPYVDENHLMYIILPFEKDGLAVLENSLTPESLQKLLDSMEDKEQTVIMPKFKIEWGKPLEDILSALGASSLFSEAKADLSGISSKEKLFVSSVVHKSFIEVNEEGTEAAAATGLKIVKYCYRPPFLVDHPFLLLIREKHSGIILFLGRVTNPSNVS